MWSSGESDFEMGAVVFLQGKKPFTNVDVASSLGRSAASFSASIPEIPLLSVFALVTIWRGMVYSPSFVFLAVWPTRSLDMMRDKARVYLIKRWNPPACLLRLTLPHLQRQMYVYSTPQVFCIGVEKVVRREKAFMGWINPICHQTKQFEMFVWGWLRYTIAYVRRRPNTSQMKLPNNTFTTTVVVVSKLLLLRTYVRRLLESASALKCHVYFSRDKGKCSSQLWH